MSSLISGILEKPGLGEKLRSSETLGWRGLVAERWRLDPCEIEPCVPARHMIVLNLGGAMRVRRSTAGIVETQDASDGTIWLCPAGASNDGVQLSGGRLDSIILALPGRVFAQSCEDYGLDPRTVSLQAAGGFRDPVIESIGRTLARELDEGHPIGAMFAETAAGALETYLLRRFSDRVPGPPLPARGALNSQRLQRTLDLINERIGDDLSLRELALETSLSVFHFARAFKAATGVAPHQYVLERRVARAKQLLEEGQLTLTEISNVCGFASQAHLTNVFKRMIGVTPGVYRSQAARR